VNQSSRRHASLLLKKSCLSVLVSVALCGGYALAQAPEASVQYAVPAGDLIEVVNEISRNSGVQIVYDIELLRGKRAAAVSGAMTVAQALDRALVGSDLHWTRVSPATISIGPKASRATPKKDESDASASTERKADELRDVKELEDVVVVGSRLGSSPVESAMPIKVITRDDIDRSGASSIAQMLSYLPEVPINNGYDSQITGQTSIADGGNTNSSTVQMRGMPRGTTLILINGRRAGDSAAFSASGIFDLSTIPLALVERIEVLPAGASAVYGGDALAGVINIVLRKDGSGVELRVRHDSADGYDANNASILWGKAWSKGGFNVAATWSKNGGLWNDERSLTADMDYRRFGGRDLRATYGSPTNIYSLEGCPPSEWACVVPLSERGNLPGLNSPVASVPEGSSGDGLRPSDFLETQGQINKVNLRRNIRSADTRYGINFDGRLALGDSVEAFTELTYTKAKVPAYQVPLSSFFPGEGGKHALLDAGNPKNPFGVDVGIDFQYKDTGIYTSFSSEHKRGLFGLRGKFGSFDWEASGWQARDTSRTDGPIQFNMEKVYAAISDPNSGFNPLVADGSAPASKDVLESLVGGGRKNSMFSKTSGINAFVRGPVMKLPTGNVTALLGIESQTFSIDFDTDDPFRLIRNVHGSSNNHAVFAEARVPVLPSRTGQGGELLAVSGALRRETSDRFSGDSMTRTVGVEFRPFDKLMLRSTYSTAFKPIITHNALENPYQLSGYYLSDPKTGGSYYVDVLMTGGAPEDLRPETSSTITMGIVYRPSEEWFFSLTNWNLKFEDQIRQIDMNSFLQNEEYYSERIIRNPGTGLIEMIDARAVNISLKETAGVDIAMDGWFDTVIGSFNPSITATYTYRFNQQLTREAPETSDLGRYNSAGWAPRWKVVPRISWDYEDSLRAMIVGRYVSKYLDTTPFISGDHIGEYQKLGGFWMVDLNLDLSLARFSKESEIMSNSRISIGSTNLFNRLPDFCNSCGFPGYDSSQYDIMGRSVYAEFRMNF